MVRNIRVHKQKLNKMAYAQHQQSERSAKILLMLAKLSLVPIREKSRVANQ